MTKGDPRSSAFAARVRRARMAAGFTQKTLSTMVGVSRPAIVQWEAGDTRHVKPENLLRVARALGVRLEWLVLGEEPMRSGELPRPRIDEHALGAIIEAADEVLAEEGLALPAGKKAAVVAALYATFVESGDVPDKSTVQRFARLAA